ncbi:helix-turn-helix domain-containing protein [Nocardia wallacei]|uniref:helix-turn-helix domain-containing protein n=1 Tax=Nocardia wallacei TaxID=480035 RepID=UPI00313B82B8
MPSVGAVSVSLVISRRGEIRHFLASRRAKITPAQVGLPTNARRRVAGLRREEVAVLAGVSTEWYTRLEKGHIGGVSEDVLDAVARALQLDDDERTYLFDLARSARLASRTPSRRRDVEVPPQVQWLLDSMTMSSAFIRNGRTDVVAGNALARARHRLRGPAQTPCQLGSYEISGGGAHPPLSSTRPALIRRGSSGRGSGIRTRPADVTTQSLCCARRFILWTSRCR